MPPFRCLRALLQYFRAILHELRSSGLTSKIEQNASVIQGDRAGHLKAPLIIFGNLLWRSPTDDIFRENCRII